MMTLPHRLCRLARRWLNGALGVGLLALSMPGWAGEPEDQLPAHRPSPYRSMHYAVEMDGASLPVTKLWPNRAGDPYTKLTVHYAATETTGVARLVVRTAEIVESFAIAPQTAPVTARARHDSVEIEVARPVKFMLRINGGEPLFLWISSASAPPLVGDSAVVEVARFGLDRTGVVNVTAGLQRAIDEAAALGPGATVLVPAGTYRTSSLWMRSGVTLWLETGAVLVSDEHDVNFPMADYSTRPGEHPGTDPRAQAAMLWFDGVCSAALRGPGTIDACGNERRQRQPGAARLRMNQVRIVDSEDIRIEGPILRDAVFWSVHLLRSRNVTIRDVKIVNEMPLAGWDARDLLSVWNNTDGINPDACQDVLIEDVFAHTGDDAFVVKATNSGPAPPPDVENIVFRRLVVASSTAGVKFGTESVSRAMRNILVEDVDFLPIHRSRGLVFAMLDRALVEHVVFRRIRFEAPLRWLDLEGGKRAPGQTECSRVRFVRFEDINLPAGATGMIRPPYSRAELAGLRFRSIRYDGEPVVTRAGLRLEHADEVPDLRVESDAREAQ